MSSVRLFFAGDFCSKPSTSFISVSEDLRDLIHLCDVSIVNFEVPLKPNVETAPGQYERFWQHDDAPHFLKKLGFNLFTIANNHIFDWGKDGYEKTKAALGDQAFGAGLYDEAYSIKIADVDGVRIGFLALSYAAYTGVFDDVMDHDGFGCAYINDLRVNHDIVDAKKKVDYLFVLPHDGIEYIDVPLPETIARYRDFIDWGADGVIGSHPHCPQGWEVYKGKPIFYSLGNFFFNSKEDTLYRAWNRPHWYEGICVILSLSDGNVQYQVVNTRNIDNISLILDKSKERETHNADICAYLTDTKKYQNYLFTQCKRLSESKEMPIIDGSFHRNTLISSTKRLFKSWMKVLLKKRVDSDYALCTLLRNDSRKNVVLRAIRRNN